MCYDSDSDPANIDALRMCINLCRIGIHIENNLALCVLELAVPRSNHLICDSAKALQHVLKSHSSLLTSN